MQEIFNTKEIESIFEISIDGEFRTKLESMHKNLLEKIEPRNVCIAWKTYKFGNKVFVNLLFNTEVFESVIRNIAYGDDFLKETVDNDKIINFGFTDNEWKSVHLPGKVAISNIKIKNNEFQKIGRLVCEYGRHSGKLYYSSEYHGKLFSFIKIGIVEKIIRNVDSTIMKSFFNTIEKGKVTVEKYIDTRISKIQKKMKLSDYKKLCKVSYERKIWFLLFRYNSKLDYFKDRKSYLDRYYIYSLEKNRILFGVNAIGEKNYELIKATDTLKFLKALEK